MTSLRTASVAALKAVGWYHPLRDWRRDRRFAAEQRRQVRAWRAAGRPPPMPDRLKYGVIRDHARRHGVRTLVETGTFYGNAIFTLRREFRAIHSIELAPELHELNRRELAHLGHIRLHLGDSTEVLPALLPRLEGPTLFWLDGHFCSGPSARGSADTPISHELDCLLARPPAADVVLIDDARLFTGTNDYPTVEQLRAIIARRRPGADFSVESDIIRIAPV